MGSSTCEHILLPHNELKAILFDFPTDTSPPLCSAQDDGDASSCPRRASGQRPPSFCVFPVQTEGPVITTVVCVVIGSSLIEQELTSPYALPYNAAQRPSGLLCVCRGDEGAERHSGSTPAAGAAAARAPAPCRSAVLSSALFWLRFSFCLQLGCFNARIRFYMCPIQSFFLSLAPRPRP